MRNDTRVRRQPRPRIKARLVPLPRESRHVARCGRCGQILWTVIDGDSLGPSWLNDLKRGWRFDPGGRIWRPTETHLRQRHAAGDRVAAGTATDLDRAHLRHGNFGRRVGNAFAGAHMGGGMGPSSRFGATADLPVAIQCPRCGAENDVEDPVAQTD